MGYLEFKIINEEHVQQKEVNRMEMETQEKSVAVSGTHYRKKFRLSKNKKHINNNATN